MILQQESKVIQSTSINRIAFAGVAAIAIIIIAGVDTASAGYRPVFTAPAFHPAPIYSAPVYRMPVFQPPPRRYIAPVVRPMPRPFVTPVIRPIQRPTIRLVVRPAVRPSYSPPRLATPHVVQPATRPYPSPSISSNFAARINPTPVRPGSISNSTVKFAPAASAQIAKTPSPAPVIVSASSNVKVNRPVQSTTVMTIVPGNEAPQKSSTAAISVLGPSSVKGGQPTQATIRPATSQLPPVISQTASPTTTIANISKAAVNTAIQAQQSKPGQILTDSLAAAGSEATTKLTPLGYAADAASVANAYLTSPNKTDGMIAAGSQLSGILAVDAAGKLGGPIGAGVMQGAVTAGNLYVAPAVGNVLYNAGTYPGARADAQYLQQAAAQTAQLQARVSAANAASARPTSSASILSMGGPSQTMTADEFNQIILK